MCGGKIPSHRFPFCSNECEARYEAECSVRGRVCAQCGCRLRGSGGVRCSDCRDLPAKVWPDLGGGSPMRYVAYDQVTVTYRLNVSVKYSRNEWDNLVQAFEDRADLVE